MHERRCKSIAATALAVCIAVLCASSLLLPVRAIAEETTSPPTDTVMDERLAKLNEYLSTQALAAHIPNLAVAVVDSEEVLMTGVYGTEATASVRTPFILGSLSKSFTALSVMQLAEKGEIDLGAPLSEYLPDAVDGDKVRICQLLNHTSGITTYMTPDNYRVVESVGKYCYANTNYTLLGRVIEEVTGMPFDEYVNDRIIGVLGMDDTFAVTGEQSAARVAQGHTGWFGMNLASAPAYPRSEDSWISVPAGYLASSAEDMAKYLQMYLRGGGGIVSPEGLDMMLCGDAAYVGGEYDAGYSYGWGCFAHLLPTPAYSHSGLVETGATFMYLIPGYDLGIALLTDTNDYLVGTEMLNTIGMGSTMILCGESADAIGMSDYTMQHAIIDAVLLIAAVCAAIPLMLLPRWKRKVAQRSSRRLWACTVLVHLVLPTVLLMALPLMGLPLWVVEGFAPDVFWTLVLACALLYIGLPIKAAIVLMRRKSRAAEAKQNL